MRNFAEEINTFRKEHRESHIQINGIHFRYWLSGKGEFTYVLLPGGMGSGEFFFLHILALEKINKVLTLDYPQGISDNNRMADVIISLIDSLELQNTIFIGQSYGGMIAQVITKRHPDKIAGLVLSNTGTATDNIIPADRQLAKMIAGQRRGLQIIKFLPYSWIKKLMRLKMNTYLRTVPEQYLQYLKDIFDAMLNVYTLERYKLMTGLLFDFHTNQRFTKKDFKTLQTRPLLIFAPDDHTFSENVRNELVSLMPHPEINRQLNGGHVALLMQIDQFTNLIKEYQWKSR